MTQETTKTNDEDQYSFWGGSKDDPWDALHAHFQREARRDGAGVVEEVTQTGKAAG